MLLLLIKHSTESKVINYIKDMLLRSEVGFDYNYALRLLQENRFIYASIHILKHMGHFEKAVELAISV